MDIKSLFKEPEKLVTETPEEIVKEIESIDFLEAKTESDRTFIPDQDFSDPKNFAKFGSAKEYYSKIFDYVAATYPFDGSHKELLDWKSGLTHLEKYVLEKQFPHSTGYLQLNGDTYKSTLHDLDLSIPTSEKGQFIKVFSGPNARTDPYKDGNILDKTVGREANLGLTPGTGNTVEFWMKFNPNYYSSPDDPYNKEFAIYDAKNDKIRFTVSFNYIPDTFKIMYEYDGRGITTAENIPLITFDASKWNHVAVSLKNGETGIILKLYVNGNLAYETETGTTILDEENEYGNPSIDNTGLVAHVGAFIESTETAVIGALPACIDEFRYWKTEKKEREIARDRFDRVYGGTDTDLFNTDLGVYFRFNEGIVDESNVNQYDQIVIDYSGRTSDGTIVNYRVEPITTSPVEYFKVRSTGSAIDESGYFKSPEVSDPIVNALNTLVISKREELEQIGYEWDLKNPSSLLNTLPSWIVDEDSDAGTGQLKSLTQIIASYFDKLYLEVKSIPQFSFSEYSAQDRKVTPFMNTILESHGISVPDIFIDSTILEQFRDRDEQLLFEDNLQNLKNLIYKNIYNNLIYIYKSKGTEKAFRNLIRAYGVDDELIKIHLYANNTNYTLENNKRESVVSKKYLDLTRPSAWVTSLVSSASVKETLYGATSDLPEYLVPLTFETCIKFPKKLDRDNVYYDRPEENQISIFGGYSVYGETRNIIPGSSDFGFEVFFVKNEKDSSGGKFKFVSKITGEEIYSDQMPNVYDGEKWNFAVRLKTPSVDINGVIDNLDNLTGSIENNETSTNSNNTFNLELYGVNVEGGKVIKDFTLSSSNLTLEQAINAHSVNKKFYVGARKEDFDGVVQNYTDIFVSNARFWFDYLSNEDVIEHAKDELGYGISDHLRKTYQAFGEKANRGQTLAFSWDFDALELTEPSGETLVLDTKTENCPGDSVFIENVVKQNALIVDADPDDDKIVRKEHVLTYKPQIPENLFSTDTINILGESDYAFTRESRPTTFFMSFEKSMYQTISEDMLNMFSGIVDFNNLLGEPLNNYRIVNRDLAHLRELFFAKIEESATLEKYIEYYKWIDTSLGYFLAQFVPASIKSSDKIRNMVENHVLETNSVVRNITNTRPDDPLRDIGIIKGIKELKYDANKGRAPINLADLSTEQGQKDHSLWLKERAERSGPAIGDTGYIAITKQALLENVTDDTGKQKHLSYDAENGLKYKRQDYGQKRLARVYDIVSDTREPVSIHRAIDTFSDSIAPYNVKNIKFSGSYTKTDKTPNYSHEYEIFNGATRDVNNKYMIENASYFADKQDYINLRYADQDYPRLERGDYRSIFVNKFSSPAFGSYIPRADLDSRYDIPQLDLFGETFSANSTINLRNKIVRAELNSYLAATSSLGDSNPIHRVNKNPQRNAAYTEFDNGFVQHQIPRTDYNYWWIAQSKLTSSTQETGGPYSSNHPNIDIQDLEILTASLESGELIDFNGVNYQKELNINDLLITPGNSVSLHKYLLKENGAYGSPTWKSTRNTYKTATVYLRKNNILNKIEQVPVEWNKPVELYINLVSNIGPNQVITNLQLNSEYSNDLDLFASESSPKSDTSTGYRTFKYSIDDQSTDAYYKLASLTHSELIWPRKSMVGLQENRHRPTYDIFTDADSTKDIKTFWRDSLSDRARNDGIKNLYGYSTSSYAVVTSFTSSFLSKSLQINHAVNTGLYSDSIWSLDSNQDNTASVNSALTVSYGQSVVGLLSPYKEFETKYFITKPLTSSATYGYLEDEGTGDIYYKYEQAERLFPRPQIIFINHQPTVYTSTSSYSLTYKNGTDVFGKNSNNPAYAYLINDGYIYEADIVSGKKPFFDSYDKFSEELLAHNKNMAMLPEYIISDKVKDIVKSGVDRTSEYLTLDGTAYSDFTAAQKLNTSDEIPLKIHEDFNNFEHDTRLNLKVNVLEKIRPKRGFYPSERIVQIAEKFTNSILDTSKKTIKVSGVDTEVDSQVSDYDSCPLDQQALAGLQPFFAPGILLNTIKSSIAVDWPIFAKNTLPYSGSLPDFYSSSVGSLPSNSKFYTIEKNFDSKVPFEALLDLSYLDKTSRVSQIPYLNPTYYSTDFISGSSDLVIPQINYSAVTNNTNNVNYKDYQLAIHNFLAEIPKFFLESDGLTKFESSPQSQFNDAIAGKKYSMRIKLTGGKTFKPYVGDFSASRNISKTIYNTYNTELTVLPVESIFGPAVRYYNSFISSSGLSGSTQEVFKIVNSPAYAPYVPPYYYGDATAELTFTATASKKYSIDEIFNNLTISYINLEQDILFRRSANICRNVESSTFDNYSSSPAYVGRMNLSACINFKQKLQLNQSTTDASGKLTSTTTGGVFSDDRWGIQTKFETPSINFINSSKSNLVELIGGTFEQNKEIKAVISSRVRGLWTSYGEPADSSDCLKLTLEDVVDTSGVTGSLAQLCGFTPVTKEIGIVKNTSKISEAIVLIPNIKEYVGIDDNPIVVAGQTIGGPDRLADTFKLYNNIENIDADGSNFLRVFKIDISEISRLLGIDFKTSSTQKIKTQIESLKAASPGLFNQSSDEFNTILDQIDKMLRYVIPPHIDWVNDKSITPFVMYVVEIEKELTRQDLSDIWQNVYPDSFDAKELKTVTLSHKFGPDQFFHGKQLSNDVEPTRFKIFKIKKRANTDYFKLTYSSADDSGSIVPYNSYNWPYDYLSIVEMANLEAEIEISNVKRFTEV